MPIRQLGTEDHAHFRGIYQQISQVLESEGFEVVRADEVTEEGSIAKDVILRLANSTLVIADLTDLNPNVFWELGVRHALRASGTLLLMDATRTSDPPFDVSYLRILKYRGTVEGLSDLRDQLIHFVRAAAISTDGVARSPVHEWIRHLPPDLSLPASESEAALRSELGDYRDRLQRYARKYGSLDDQEVVDDQAPAERMLRMRRLAGAGLLPAQMMETIEGAVKQRDISVFIDKVSDAINNRVDFSPTDIIRMTGWADNLALEEVTDAILTFGSGLHPTHEQLARSRLTRLAQARSPEDRAVARERIARLIGFDLGANDFIAGRSTGLVKQDFVLLAFLTSSLHADDQDEQSLAVCEAFVRAYPGRAPVMRLLGRSQEWMGDLAAGTATMQEALKQADVDDTTSTWLGNTFHNCGRHVDAVEMYLVSCWIDSDDSNWFAQCAQELSFALSDPYAMYDPHSPITLGVVPRELPPELTSDAVQSFACCALSTSAPSADALNTVSTAINRSEMGVNIEELFAASQALTRSDRRRVVAAVYETVQSDLTRDCPMRARPVSVGRPAREVEQR